LIYFLSVQPFPTVCSLLYLSVCTYCLHAHLFIAKKATGLTPAHATITNTSKKTTKPNGILQNLAAEQKTKIKGKDKKKATV